MAYSCNLNQHIFPDCQRPPCRQLLHCAKGIGHTLHIHIVHCQEPRAMLLQFFSQTKVLRTRQLKSFKMIIDKQKRLPASSYQFQIIARIIIISHKTRQTILNPTGANCLADNAAKSLITDYNRQPVTLELNYKTYGLAK